MKTKRNLVIVFIIAVMIQPFLFKAQDLNKPKPWVSNTPKKVGWQPVKLDDKGTYVQNGIEFYSQKAECATNGKVTLFKLVNTNNYAVRVSYQLSADSPAINIMVAAAATIEGTCGVTDGNLAKLVVNLPTGKTDEEKQKNNDFMRSHLVVSQIK